MMITSADKKYPAGSIVATASVAGLRSNAGSSDYSASKSGVISLAQTLSYQLAGTGIRINAICPGVIETGMTAAMYEAARARGTQQKIGQLNPLRRGAHADEVARVALFLGSDESSYVNGQAWAVDGGLSAGHPFVPGKYRSTLFCSFTLTTSRQAWLSQEHNYESLVLILLVELVMTSVSDMESTHACDISTCDPMDLACIPRGIPNIPCHFLPIPAQRLGFLQQACCRQVNH